MGKAYPTKIKKLSPAECELIYTENDATLHFHVFGMDARGFTT